MANNAAAKSFIDSVEEGQKLGMQILPKLTDPEMRQSYMDQQAELYSKIKSPEFSWGLGSADVMSAYQPPEPTANVVMGQWTKQLTPLVKEATDVGINGVERINRDKLVNTIARITSYNVCYTKLLRIFPMSTRGIYSYTLMKNQKLLQAGAFY